MNTNKKLVEKTEKGQPKKRIASHPPPIKTNPTKVEYFKDIVATIREPLLVLDTSLRVLAANRSFYKFFKVKAGETIGRLVYDLGNQQWDNPALRALLETILPQKTVFNDYEMEHEFPSIGRRILLLNARRIPGPSKEAQWILLAFEDVTQRMELERSLQASEKRFLMAFETATDNMLLVDKTSGKILNSNQAAQHTFSYSKQTLLKKNLWELDILKDHLEFEQVSEELEKKGAVEIINNTIHTRRGGQFLADIHLMDRTSVIQCNIRDISERKQAEEVLRETEERYRLVFEYSGTANALFDTECRVILQNGLSKKLTEPMDALGKTALEVFGPEQGRVVTERMRRVLTSGKPETFETEFVLPVGPKWIYSAYQPLMNQQNAISGVLVISQDITERKQMEDALRKSETQLRTVFDATPFPIALVDTQDNNIFYWSKSAITQFGHTAPTVPEWYQIAYPDPVYREEVVKRWIPNLEKARLSGLTVNTGEYRVTCKDGSVRNCELYASFLGDKLIVTFNDITERKQAEDALSESEKRIRVLLNALPDMMFHLDRNGVFLDYKAEKSNLYSETEDIIGKRNRDITPPEFADLIEHYINATLTTGEMQIFNYQLPVSDHGLRDYEARMVASGTDEVTAIVRDITERKRGETELVIANKELLFQNEEKEKRAVELAVANKELAFQNEEKEKRAAELAVANKELAFQNKEKEKRAAELVLANEETVRRLQYIQALHKIDQAIAGSLDLNLTLNVVLEQAKTQLNIDAAAVLLLNPHTQILGFTSGLGFRSKAIERSRVRLGEGYSGRAALERKTVSITNLLEKNTQFDRATLLADEGFATYFGTPLIAKGQVNGVLEIYHRTPFAPDENWMEFFKILAGQAAIAVDSTSLFTDLIHSNAELFAAYDSTIEGWSHALDLRDKETEGHSLRVTEMTLKLARAAGITEEELVHVRRGALLHDIGKMGVPDHILLKPDKLTDEEWVVMRKHPTFAFELLSPIAYLRPALDIPYCHHEKWDGSGYPRGLKGEQIPLAARLFAIIDVWDALRSDRPYRQGWSKEKVIEHIKSLSGTHFEPKAVELFFNMMNEDEKNAG